MERLDYAQSVVTTRVYEKRLLDKARLERMIDALDADEVFRILMETEYTKSMEGVEGPADYEKMLKNETERVYKLVGEMSQDNDLIKILSLEYDYHNLRVVLKELLVGRELGDILMDSGSVSAVQLKTEVFSGHYVDTPEEFVEAIDHAKKVYEETGDAQMIDLVMDAHYYAHIKKLAEAMTDAPLFTEYAEGLIDFNNVITLLRSKRMGKDIHFLEHVIQEGGAISKNKIVMSINDDEDRLIHGFRSEKIGRYLKDGLEAYKENGKLSQLEKFRDNYLIQLTGDARYIAFGPEPIFAYLLRKEREIQAVRMIMVAKLNNIPADKIRERLRDISV